MSERLERIVGERMFDGDGEVMRMRLTAVARAVAAECVTELGDRLADEIGQLATMYENMDDEPSLAYVLRREEVKIRKRSGALRRAFGLDDE